MSSDLEDQNEADDWKSTNSHEGELVIAFGTNSGNNALRPRIFYALYIGPNNDGNKLNLKVMFIRFRILTTVLDTYQPIYIYIYIYIYIASIVE